jgi:hypothetical protein
MNLSVSNKRLQPLQQATHMVSANPADTTAWRAAFLKLNDLKTATWDDARLIMNSLSQSARLASLKDLPSIASKTMVELRTISEHFEPTTPIAGRYVNRFSVAHNYYSNMSRDLDHAFHHFNVAQRDESNNSFYNALVEFELAGKFFFNANYHVEAFESFTRALDALNRADPMLRSNERVYRLNLMFLITQKLVDTKEQLISDALNDVHYNIELEYADKIRGIIQKPEFGWTEPVHMAQALQQLRDMPLSLN